MPISVNANARATELGGHGQGPFEQFPAAFENCPARLRTHNPAPKRVTLQSPIRFPPASPVELMKLRKRPAERRSVVQNAA